MRRIWNYFFYSTWKFQISFGEAIIEKPLIYLFNLVPFLRNNWSKGKNEYKRAMHDKDYGFNIGFAFGFMLLSTMVIYTSICLILVKLLSVEVGDTIYYYFFAIVTISYLTNELLIYRADTYKKYFDEFEKVSNKPLIYLSAVLFHIGIMCFGILSAYFTVGFNF